MNQSRFLTNFFISSKRDETKSVVRTFLLLALSRSYFDMSKANVACSHLSNDDNELIFNLVNEKSFSLCTAIAEVHQTTSPAHSMWIKFCVGALCFEKDYARKSYFFRLYCLMRHQLVWEQEIYRHMKVAPVRPYLLSFEGDVSRTRC